MLAKKKKKVPQANQFTETIVTVLSHLHRETMLHQNKTKHTIISIFFVAVSLILITPSVCLLA